MTVPRSSQPTRKRILENAYGLFYRRGFVRVGVDEVAEASGVTKRTLYSHFESKDALLAAVLEFQHELALARVRRWTEELPDGAGAMIDRLFADLDHWAAKPRFEGSGFTRLVMELADLPGHPARKIARRHKAALEDWLVGEFARRKVRDARRAARETRLLLEGAMALMLIHGDRSYGASAAQAAKRLIAS